jgi:RHS repeat-associated protein
VADHLGSVVRVTDSAANPIVTREYDPWGGLLQGVTTGGYAFTGREWDAETELYYYRARYYDPVHARFLSSDPLTSTNQYLYVGNRPLASIDPSGLVELNLLKKEPLHSAAEKCVSPAGVFTVAAHGNSREVLDQYTGDRLQAKALAARMRARPGWKEKPQRVWLVGCDAATGPDSLAQQLADELQCPVSAVADGKVKWWPNLNEYCGFSPDPYTNGHWTIKSPRAKKK